MFESQNVDSSSKEASVEFMSQLDLLKTLVHSTVNQVQTLIHQLNKQVKYL